MERAPLPSLLQVPVWIALIEFGAALMIVGYCVAALGALLLGRGIVQVRLLVAEGVLWGLSFKVAAALLKTLTLRTWEQLAFFVIILGLRILVKWVLTWERARLVRHEASG